MERGRRNFLILTGTALCAAALPQPARAAGRKRAYFIAAEEVDWDFCPTRRDEMMGMPLTEDEDVFVRKGRDRIGSVYRMIRYTGFADATFKTRLPQEDKSLGILGPVIRAEVGDEIEVTFRNMSSKPVSVHPHGVFYDKLSEGSMTNDGTSADQMKDDHVPPGQTYVYHWQVPERAGPAAGDPSSIVWLYHSHVDEMRDTNSGLVGPMVITRAGEARDDGTPKDADREEFCLFAIFDENLNLFMPEMRKRLRHAPHEEDEEFHEANLKHSINGFIMGNMPMPAMKVGERVRWYMLALGTETDLHTPHWHGNTVVVGGHRKDVVELLPATTLVADMVPDNPGIWMFHCHVNDHIAAGMTARYQVLSKA